jgi:hypothetical protein
MSALDTVLDGVKIPRMYMVEQKFESKRLGDITAECRKQLSALRRLDSLSKGAEVAIAVGSRGVASIDVVARAVVDTLTERGLVPFIVPSMGSHGNATAAGQTELLAGYNITEESMGCEIRSNMEVVEVGRLPNGLKVYMDRVASEADGIVVINRVKTHPGFDGTYESGIVKMLSIGMGNHIGATSCHQLGFGMMEENIKAMAKIKMEQCPVLCGVAVIEDAYDEVAEIHVLDVDEIFDKEPELLRRSKANMAAIGFGNIDVLVVDRMGKEISGDGMDPRITGKYSTPFATGGPNVNKLVVLSPTEKTHGNVIGIGPADFTTQRLYDQIDFEATYINSITATVTAAARMPLVMKTDYDAIRAAIQTCNALDLTNVRLVRILDTLHLNKLMISEALVEEAKRELDVVSMEGPMELTFKDGVVTDVFD